MKEAANYSTEALGVVDRLLCFTLSLTRLLLPAHLPELSKQTELALRLPQGIDIAICRALPSPTTSREWFGLIGGVSPTGRG